MLSALDSRTSPFSEGQIQRLQQGLEGLDPTQSAWLSGYLAGRLAASLPAEAAAVAASADATVDPAPALEIFYASETGNGQGVAEALARRAGEAGLRLPLRALDGYRPAGLARLRRAVFVISTHGEGDPPEEAADLFGWLDSPRAADLSQLEFRILALGDSSYAQFCAAGRRLEQLLEARGARAFAPRVDCDVDYDDASRTWCVEVLDYARRQAEEGAAVNSGPGQPAASHLSVVPAESGWTRQRPFRAEVLDIRKITGLESSKEVYHLELSLADSGIRYQPGDALGVWPLNAEANVAAVLGGLGIAPSRTVEHEGETHSMRDWLLRFRELTRLTPATVRSYAEFTRDGALAERLGSLAGPELRRFLEARQFIDLVEEFPARIEPEQLLGLLRPLSPRSYSIASSQAALGDEVHLTVASLFSDAIGQPRRGVASEHLNRTLGQGDRVAVYLEPNRRFRLPDDATAPLVMIGAGTGIAPYRAFLQQLEAGNRNPDSWLIFGNPNLRSDFLYQREWLRWRESGLLRRIDCAFSRDQAQKRYVQHVVEENAAELAEWLERGAHLYLCGGLAMGQAVEQALLRHVAPRLVAAGTDADGWLAALRQQRRLSRDLY